MASRPGSVRKVQLETKCCQTKTRFEIGVEDRDGFPYCGGCGCWCPELQVVREVAERVPPPASGPRQVQVPPDRSYVEGRPRSLKARHDLGGAAPAQGPSKRRTSARAARS
jgi:hypothetical protein